MRSTHDFAMIIALAFVTNVASSAVAQDTEE
jgi:hypothetical protein